MVTTAKSTKSTVNGKGRSPYLLKGNIARAYKALATHMMMTQLLCRSSKSTIKSSAITKQGRVGDEKKGEEFFF